MPAYSFEALDAQGATRRGVMEADTAKAVRSLLRAQALVPLQVTPVSSGAADEQGAGWSATRVQPLGLQRHPACDLDAATGRLDHLRPAAGARPDGADRRSGARARAPPGGGPSRRSQRRIAFWQGAGALPARVPRHLHGGDRRRRAKRQPGPRAGAAGGRPGRAAGPEGQAAGCGAVPRHREPGRHRDRAVPGGLCGAPGRQRICRQQARPALSHRGHAGRQRLRAQLGLAGGAASWRAG